MYNFEKSANDQEKETLDVIGEIELIRQMCEVRGAQTDENDRLNSIKENWQNKLISDEEAVRQARQVYADKYDYR